jgi:membrane-associated protease RseP (regulator of RpoE activity)
VLYTLRAIPLGGYVEFADDDGSGAYAPDDPQLLRNKSIPSRALVISAGVLANLVFSLAVLFAQVGCWRRVCSPGRLRRLRHGRHGFE